jgi:hypothetical protein
MGHALLHSPARRQRPATVACSAGTRAGIWVLLGEAMRRRRRVVTHSTQALIKNKANNGRPIDGRLLSKETR